MKKINLLLILILFSIISCQKEESELKSNSEGFKDYQAIGMIESNVLDFLKRLDTAAIDSEISEAENWNYSLDSANWYLEAAFNYRYSYPNRDRSDLLLDSFTVIIDLESESYVNIYEIVTIVDSIHYNISSTYNSLSEEYKFLVGLDLKYSYGTKYTVNCKYYIGLYNINLPDGDWRVAYNGMCNVSGYNGYDGAKINQEIFKANLIHEQDVFFTDQSDIYDGIPYCTVNQNYDYSPCSTSALYEEVQANSNNFLTCLDEDRMKIYIDNAITSLDAVYTQHNKNLYITDIYFSFDFISSNMSYHHYYVFEGIMAKAWPRDIHTQSNTYLN